MNHSDLLLSRFPISSGLESVIEQTVQWKNELNGLGVDVALELPVQRVGRKGWIADNPPIEEIDQIFTWAHERQSRFRSLLLPIELDQSEKTIGQEISAIDGWTDLASYADIPLIRLVLQHPEAFEKKSIQDMFQTIVDYMIEMEIHTAIQIPDAAFSAQSGVLTELLREKEQFCGWDLRVSPDAFPSASAIDFTPTTISALLRQPFQAVAIKRFYDEIRSGFGDGIKAVIVELE